MMASSKSNELTHLPLSVTVSRLPLVYFGGCIAALRISSITYFELMF